MRLIWPEFFSDVGELTLSLHNSQKIVKSRSNLFQQLNHFGGLLVAHLGFSFGDGGMIPK